MRGETTPNEDLMCLLSVKRLVNRPRHRWVDNIERDARDLGLEGLRKEWATDWMPQRNGCYGFRLWSPV